MVNRKGVVFLSVCNLHKKRHSASEMVTQALLGTSVSILRVDLWYKIKLDDGYVGWVHPSAIVVCNEIEFAFWAESPKIIIMEHYGFAYEQPNKYSQCVSDVVSGNRFRFISDNGMFYEVSYPNGKIAYVEKKIAMFERGRLATINKKADEVLKIARSLCGIPYLWGGTSSKGVDCSGFVKLCFLLCDIKLPRDADQQSYIGNFVDIDDELSSLQLCDLLFFGKKSIENSNSQVEHVAIYLGEGRYIHSQGYVRINSLFEFDNDFDLTNKNRLLFVKRVL